MVKQSNNSTQRSIDSLQRLYAIVVALALVEAVRRFLINPTNGVHELQFAAVTQFLALVATLIPFYHGMHRHLDHKYLENSPQGAIAIIADVLVFITEGCLFFVLATLLLQPVLFLWVLAALLMIDSLWAWFSYYSYDRATSSPWQTHSFRWGTVNIATAVALLLIESISVLGYKSWWMSGLLIVRAVVDYTINSSFYFPGLSGSAKKLE